VDGKVRRLGFYGDKSELAARKIKVQIDAGVTGNSDNRRIFIFALHSFQKP